MNPLLHRPTRCLIVQPKFSDFSFWNYIDVCRLVGAKYPAAPLGLMTVAGLLPQEWEFKLVDENIEPLRDSHLEWAEIVCCGGMLPQQAGIQTVIRRAHQFKKQVIVGGPDPTSQPEMYGEADYLVLGEGEVTIPMMLADWENGVLAGRYQSPNQADMTRSVIPRFDLIRFEDYLHVGIQYSRGCPFNCEFCDIIELYGRVPRSKSAGQVTAELQRLLDLGYRGHVDFVDDNLIGNKKNLKIALPIIHQWMVEHSHPFFFSTEASINLVSDEALMKMMQELDFRYLFIGIETPEDEILRQTQKKQNCKVSIKEAIQKIGEYGMIVNAGFILGFDTEGKLSAQHMIDCIQDSGVCMAMVGLLTALPNTQLTRRLTTEGRLTTHGMEISDAGQIDQTTSGLNFTTLRPRIEILQDYLKIIESVYHPKNYYDRVLLTARQLHVANKHKPGLGKILNMAKAFTKLCWKISWNRKIRKHYWSMFFKVLFGTPHSIEAAVNLGAMYLHFHKQSEYLKRLMTNKITNLALAKAA